MRIVSRKRRLKILLLSIVFFLIFLIGHRLVVFSSNSSDYGHNLMTIDWIKSSIVDRENFSFVVVGNVKNSGKIFDLRMMPLIESEKVDFLISAGNSVYNGGEDKYRLIKRSFSELGLPYLLTAGENELKDDGMARFYRYFGPPCFSFSLKDSAFIFIDSTGETDYSWQLSWLELELKNLSDYRSKFLFMSDSPLEDDVTARKKDFFSHVRTLVSKYNVDVVFSASEPVYKDEEYDGARYIVSGCGGGLLLDERQSRYQYVKASVEREGITLNNVTVPNKVGFWRYKLATLACFIHSILYVNLFYFLLIIGIFSLLAVKIYSLIIRQEHLYRDFSIDEDTLIEEPLKVAMFTNNYLPFIGGVPISIERLCSGLRKASVSVRVFAPTFPRLEGGVDEDYVFRYPTLFHVTKSYFPVANILSREGGRMLEEMNPDVVHVHHPFWLGKKGLKLAQRLAIPVVFTYHTRLDRYAHYIPLPGVVLKNMVTNHMIKSFANKCDAIITPTSSTEEYLRNLGVSSLVETIPTGIDLSSYREWSDENVKDLRLRQISEGVLLISVARLAKEKNIDFLIDGLARVKERSAIHFKCMLIGDGPERERLVDKVRTMGLDDCIVFIGKVPHKEVSKYYLASDIFVFASTSETQGMVLLEAMAGGCPVVAVNASGVYDVVENGYNGYKVPESLDSWADHVMKLMEDEKRRLSMGEKSRVYASKFSTENISERVLKLYRRTVILKKSEDDICE